MPSLFSRRDMTALGLTLKHATHCRREFPLCVLVEPALAARRRGGCGVLSRARPFQRLEAQELVKATRGV